MTTATPSIAHHTVTANGIRQHYIDIDTSMPSPSRNAGTCRRTSSRSA
nr:hypothetical protein [Burkholderia sp. BCC0322]